MSTFCSVAAAAIAWPMRPLAPLMRMRMGMVNWRDNTGGCPKVVRGRRQATPLRRARAFSVELREHLLEDFRVRRTHLAKRRAHFCGANDAGADQRGFDRNRIRLDEQRLEG